ncbi:hypothetical protein [Endozoicomonas sp. ONNA1]|uniref:hypothetical protein n=1 Tax=Endozoicomonas sp. ONNA1 TaxID=2828740 RepID=UPI002147F696|nr:hypothetical protein [Endozoicomonas sp. ONNA1]
MNKKFLSAVQKRIPKFNPLIGNGIAVAQMEYAAKMVDDIWRASEAYFPKGLKYVGCERCSPIEMYRVMAEKKRGRRSMERARSDVYLMKYHFEWTEPGSNRVEKLKPKYCLLPFARKGGLITIRGAHFCVSPAMIDPTFSVVHNGLFIHPLKARISIESAPFSFLANGQRNTSSLAFSAIYNKKASGKKSKRRGITAPTLGCYLFAKFGVTEVFLRAGTEVKVDTVFELERTLDQEEWVICSSTRIKPVNFGKRRYEPSDTAIAVPKSNYTPLVKSLVGAYMHLVDNYPDQVLPEFVNDERLWRKLLGMEIFEEVTNYGQLLSSMEEHLHSLDAYIDVIVREEYAKHGLHVNDMYDLMFNVIETMPVRMLKANNAGLYNKEIITLKYVLFDIYYTINNVFFRLLRGGDSLQTLKDIEEVFRDKWKRDLILNLHSSKHSVVNPIDSPSMCMLFEHTGKVIPQSSVTRKSAHSSASVDETKFLDASLAEVVSYTNQRKFEPTGRAMLNPYALIDIHGVIHRNEKFAELIHRTDKLIRAN